MLAYPFRVIFDSEESAEWAFALMARTLHGLGITEADDPRLAITWRQDASLIRVNFCSWAIMDVGARHGTLVLPESAAPSAPDMQPWGTFAGQENESDPLKGHTYPLTHVHAMQDELLPLYDETLQRIAQRFAAWTSSPYHRHHRREIAVAILDAEQRAQILKEGLVFAAKLDAFVEAARSFDRSSLSDSIAEAQIERQNIGARFPLDAWPDLPLERYALGQENSQDTYCYWLEFGAVNLGSMRGGSAVKHIIYKHKDKSGWSFPSEYSDVQVAWEAVRAAFVQMFALAAADEWDEIPKLDVISGGRALRTKSLHVYFPDKVLPITSAEHLKQFLSELGAYRHEMRYWDPVILNRILLRVLRSAEELDDWSTNELGLFLYRWFEPNQSVRIVKVAPGQNAEFWEDCLAGGYICVGWDEVGDLNAFENHAAFRERFKELAATEFNYDAATTTRKAKELWMLRELEPGDIVVANRGVSEVLGLGTVTDRAYEWSDKRSEYRHIVHVEWDTTCASRMTLPGRWRFSTVATVSPDLHRRILEQASSQGEVAAPTPEPVVSVKPPPLYVQLAESLARKGQLILYGPPGTGKTYHARGFATWWLLKQMHDARAGHIIGNRVYLKQVEQELTAGQSRSRTWWMVANPKEWRWDELFADGAVDYRQGRIQRNYPLMQPGDLVIGYQSTPDKRIMALATVSEGLHLVDGEPKISLQPLRRIANGMSYEELLADPLLAKSEPLRNRCQGTLFALAEAEAELLLTQLSERNDGLEDVTGYDGGVSPLTWVTFHPSYSYEDFVEGFRPVDSAEGGLVLRMEDGLFKRICRAAQANPTQPYLIVIDEINRANLAKVFGELITLLEKDKRGLTITLPQSKEAFYVPDNVYLLGTMNTADRSIKLMDTALRRRFAFIELMPDVAPLAGAEVDGLALDAFLLTLNRRIAATVGREKQLGHALLMEDGEAIADASEFARRFRQEILPLLQEYCYDNFDDLADYVGVALVDAGAQQLNADVLNDDDELLAALVAVTARDSGND